MSDHHQTLKRAAWLLLGCVNLATVALTIGPGLPSHTLPLGGPSTLHRRQVDPDLAATCKADTFTSALPAGFAIEKADTVQEGGQYGEGEANKGYPTPATRLPSLCAVIVKFTSTTSNYRFGMFLPRVWNGKMLTVGGGSFAGGINWAEMAQGPRYHGMVGLSTDTGHNSGPNDLSWGVGEGGEERIKDWGSRAMHGSVTTAKVLVEKFYGKKLDRSYYSGCSTGGRQGLKEIQTAADSFDGALIGAPAWQTTHLGSWTCAIGKANLPTNPAAKIDEPQFKVLAAAALQQCDKIGPFDDRKDNIISASDRCTIDLSKVLCSNGQDPTTCLTQPQIDTARFMYNDVKTAAGEFIHSGYSIGSEDTWNIFLSFGNPENFNCEYIKQWVYKNTKPNFKTTDFNDQVFRDTKDANPGGANADKFDISSFRTRGGKILMYAGLADAIVPARHTEVYYNRSMEAMGKDLNDFFRYFRVPGMQHCFLSPAAVNAPWMFAGSHQATTLLQYFNFGDGVGVPNMDKTPEKAREYDAMEALMAWVEQKRAPDSITATAWNGVGKVVRQRPICPWPARAVFKGGDENAAASWKCEKPQ